MARSRNIKPGYFLNTKLASLHFAARILFSGLWCLADREGRLEDDHLRIKAQLLPYDNVDVNSLLDDLQSVGFIERYEYENEQYIQIVNFLKHQNPHKNETASVIPAPEITGVTRSKNGSARVIDGSTRADSFNLIPDSLSSDCLSTILPAPKSVRPKRGGQIPDDFVVTEHHEELAMQNDWPSPHDEISAFRDYHMARGTVFKDWDRAFYTWLRNAKKFAKSKISKIGAEDGERNRRKSITERFWEDFEERAHR